MENTNWLRQTADKPLFPDVLWSRPENKRHAGKLLVIGGHAQSFSAVSSAFVAASKAGAGTVRILLPDSLQKTLGGALAEAEYAVSTPIGSFSQKALAQMIDLSEWADAVLLAGDFGKNSETAILLEKFVDKYSGLLCLSGDSLDYFISNKSILERDNTLIVGEISQIQKLAQPRATIRQQAELAQLVNMLSNFTEMTAAEFVTFHDSQLIVAVKGQVSTTKIDGDINSEELAAYTSVWRLQQPDRAFESLTTAVFCLNK